MTRTRPWRSSSSPRRREQKPAAANSFCNTAAEIFITSFPDDSAISDRAATAFATTLLLVESLGSDNYVHVAVPEDNRAPRSALSGQDHARRGDALVARLINPGPIGTGGSIRLSFDPADLHVFDPGTGAALR